jgi:surfeit locus 1 family protein
LAAALLFALLLWLGTWQVHRLAWKEGVLARIGAAEKAPAVPLPPNPAPYQKVRVTGTPRNDLTALYGDEVRTTPEGTQMGGQLIVPLERPGAPPVLVDRGWVPTTRAEPLVLPAGPVTIEGFVQPAVRPGAFSGKPDLAMRRFYTLDPQEIGAALGLKEVAPFTVVALGPARPQVFPAPAHHLPRPPNNHLSYAITWYALAAILLGMFLLWARKVLRE